MWELCVIGTFADGTPLHLDILSTCGHESEETEGKTDTLYLLDHNNQSKSNNWDEYCQTNHNRRIKKN